MSAPSPATETPRSWLDRNFSRLLVSISLLGLIPRLILGSSQFIGFDGWWHLFVATQDRWGMLLAEWKWIAHPPLFYPLLRFVARLGHSYLMYRSIGILCGAIATVIIGTIAAKLYRYKASALMAAAAYTFAWNIIDLNCEVRAYPMAILFVLLAFNALVDWTSDPAGDQSGRAVFRFGAWSLLAILSEYYVVFFLAGCAGILILRLILRPTFRASFLHSVRRDWKPWLFTTIAPPLLFLTFAVVHMSALPQGVAIFQSYFFSEDSPLGLDGFLLSNTTKEMGYFTPFNLDPNIMLALVGLFFVPALIYFAFVRKDRWRGPLSADPPFLVAASLAQIVILSLLKKYPYGGEFRHQSILAPFVFLTAFLLVDRLASAINAPALRTALFLITVSLVAASFVFGWVTYPWHSSELYTAEYAKFRAMFPAPESIYGDQSSTLYFYSQAHKSRWTFQDRFLVDDQRIVAYRVDDGTGHSTRLLRNKKEVFLDLASPATYQVLADVMRHEKLKSAILFHEGLLWDDAATKVLEARFRALAPTAGLECGRYIIGPGYAYIELKLTGGAGL